jgi:hypothetical protein
LSWTFKAQRSGVLYDIPSFLTAEMGFAMSDVSGFKMTYAKNGVNAAQLVDDTVVIAYWNGVEPFNARWILRGGEEADQVEGTDFSVIGKSLLDIFRKAIVYPIVLGGNNNLEFTGATAGAVMKNIIDAAQARGALTGITYNFTNTLDSNSVAWSKVFNIEYALGLDYLKIIQNLFDKGLCEFRMNGTQLQMFNLESMGTDRSTGAGLIELVAGRDLAEAPMRWSTDDKVKRILVVGDNNVTVERTSGVWTAGPFGDEEGSVSQGGTKDTALLQQIGDFALGETDIRQNEFTRKIVFHENSKIPAVDYQVGDRVRERLIKDSVVYRVRAIVISTDGPTDSMAASVLLNDEILEAQIKNARRVEGIIGGAGAADALPSTDPTEPVVDTTTPSNPTSLLVSSSAYFDVFGIPRALATLDWSAPTTNTNGSALTDLQDYEVQWKYTIDGSTAWRTVIVTDSDTVISDLQTGLILMTRVRARDNGTHVSGWATGTNHTLAADAVAPTAPSTPGIIVYLGTVRVTWDGLNNVGGPMPVDFSHINAYRSATSGFTPDSTNYFGRIDGGAGQLVVTGQPYGTPWYYKFKAVDNNGNVSTESAQASATTAAATSGDLATGVAGNKVYYSTSAPVAQANTAGDIWWHRNVSNQIVGMYVGQGGTTWQSMPYTNSVIANLDAGKITTGSLDAARLAADSITAVHIAAGAVDAVALTADAIDGKTITGVLIIAGTFKTAATGNERIEIVGGTGATDNEIRFYPDATGDPTVMRTSAVWGSATKRTLSIVTPIKYYAAATIPNYYNTESSMGDTNDFGDTVPGFAWYVLGSPSPADWPTGDATPESYVRIYDGKVDLFGSERVNINGPFWPSDHLEVSDSFTDSSAVNVTSTSGADLGARGGQLTYVCPYSTDVTIFFQALLKAPADGSYIACGPQVRTGATINSGTVVVAYEYFQSAENYNAQYVTVMGFRHINHVVGDRGLTFNVAMKTSVQSGTGSAARGRLWVRKG